MATLTKPRATRTKKSVTEQPVADIIVENPSLLSKFVFMDKTLALLEIGLKTEKHIVLYGPGGHGKSELTMEFFYEKEINPYVITMGTGLTTDRLFGGLDVPVFHQNGKIEYLVENSFMNHEYVIFEEMMDAPDFILEQLKDILSSGVFRNGTQVFPIKTRFIVCNTNKTRDEFSKNDSLKALMERFPLEHNVVWANYTDISYNTLLEKRFGVGRIDPIIPFLLQEYVKNGVTISPRIALDCYEIYETCGPDSLVYIAEFCKKPELITEALKKFQATIKFKQTGAEINDIINILNKANTGHEDKEEFVQAYTSLKSKLAEVKKLVVTDDLAQVHANLTKACNDSLANHLSVYNEFTNDPFAASVSETKTNVKYSVILEAYSSSKLETVKLVKELTSLSLKETKELVDNIPSVIKTNLSKTLANSVIHTLKSIGAVARLNQL